jgi:hypothetical protein
MKSVPPRGSGWVSRLQWTRPTRYRVVVLISSGPTYGRRYSRMLLDHFDDLDASKIKMINEKSSFLFQLT